MARLAFDVLGDPGRDNAVLVRIHTGQAIYRLLFDCGEGCAAALSLAEIQAIDYLFFSHLHMDHVAGFDTYFRANFNRTARPNLVWGPPQTTTILQHRMQGFMWNLADRLQATWQVHDVLPDQVVAVRYQADQAFAVAHAEPARPRSGPLVQHSAFTVDAIALEHGTPSLGYLVQTMPRRNVDPDRLAQLGLTPGAWLQRLKYPQPGDDDILELNGRAWSLLEVRQHVLIETPGESLAYLTDFYLAGEQLAQLANAIRGCDTVICESQYCAADAELAQRNFHMTSVMAAQLAQAALAGRLVLFHMSERYTASERALMLHEARSVFAQTYLAPGWE
jgi:ribonuclease Z